MVELRLRALARRVAGRAAESALQSERLRESPELFATEILGSRWWSAQREVARSVAQYRRVAVRSANGVGKTYLAADIALWFLYTHSPSLVLTTAPTLRQVRFLLWEEVRRRIRGARIALPGKLFEMRLDIADKWLATGLTANDDVSFQGFHAENLLILLDEASGVSDRIWHACEGVAVGANNKIVAIGNPLRCSGRFYEVFQDKSGWRLHGISAMDHPNVTGSEPPIAGAVSREAIGARVGEWCERAEGASLATGRWGETANGDAATWRRSDEAKRRDGKRLKQVLRCAQDDGLTADGDGSGRNGNSGVSDGLFCWDGALYRPNNLFRARVLGVFPEVEADSLIQPAWVERAMRAELEARGACVIAVDVARFGDDSTVIGVRRGPVMVWLEEMRGQDTMRATDRVVELAQEWRAERVSVDDCGVGGGVTDRLMQLGVEGVDGVNGSRTAYNSLRFANRRAEMYWNLRDRLRNGEIQLMEHPRLRTELAAIKYDLNDGQRIKIESKDDMRNRGVKSPDFADMAAMLFDGIEVEMVVSAPRTGRASGTREREVWGVM